METDQQRATLTEQHRKVCRDGRVARAGGTHGRKPVLPLLSRGRRVVGRPCAVLSLPPRRGGLYLSAGAVSVIGWSECCAGIGGTFPASLRVAVSVSSGSRKSPGVSCDARGTGRASGFKRTGVPPWTCDLQAFLPKIGTLVLLRGRWPGVPSLVRSVVARSGGAR